MALTEQVNDEVNEVNKPTNRERAVALRAEGMTMAEIGFTLGVSAPAVHKMLHKPSGMPVAKLEAASRTLAELAESTRAAGAEVFEIGMRRARRRMKEVEAGDDDAATQAVLATAKLSTEGARIIHGWGETNQASSGRVAIQVIGDLRGLVRVKDGQPIDVEQVATENVELNDLSSHSKSSEQAEKP